MQDIAKELGLDIEKFTKDLSDPGLQNLINRDLSEGMKAEVQGTPTLFMNGKSVNLRSLEGLQQMIEKEVKKGNPPAAKMDPDKRLSKASDGGL